MSKPNSEERKIELQKFIEDTKGMSFLNRALKWFQQNVNEIVLAEELAIIPGKKNNPINHNMRRIFELHDKNKFEIFIYSFSNKQDDITAELKNNVDKFTNISNLSDEEAVYFKTSPDLYP